MKRLLTILILFAALSCVAQTNFGIKSYQSETDATSLGIKYIRNSVTLSTGMGLRSMQPGFHYVTNVLYVSGGKVIPTAVQIPGAKSQLISLLKAAPFLPSMLVVDNEENFNETNGSVDAVINWIRAVKEVADQFGIHVSNGGISMPGLRGLAYDYYLSIGNTVAAATLKDGRCTKVQLTWLNSYTAALKADSLINEFTFHYQFSNVDSGEDYILCIHALETIMPGYLFMNNELAQRDTSPVTTTLMINSSKILADCILYNMTGQQGKAKPFNSAMMSAAGAALK